MLNLFNNLTSKNLFLLGILVILIGSVFFYWIEYLVLKKTAKKKLLSAYKQELKLTGISKEDRSGLTCGMFRSMIDDEHFDFISHCAYGILNNIYDLNLDSHSETRYETRPSLYDNIVFLKHCVVFISSLNVNGVLSFKNEEFSAKKNDIPYPLPSNIRNPFSFLKWGEPFLATKSKGKKNIVPRFHIIFVGKETIIDTDKFSFSIGSKDEDVLFLVRTEQQIYELLQLLYTKNFFYELDMKMVKECISFYAEATDPNPEIYNREEGALTDFSIEYQNTMRNKFDNDTSFLNNKKKT